MPKKNKIGKAVCFCLLICLINRVLGYALIPASYMRLDFWNIREKTYDDIFIGTSHGFAGIDPVTVDAVTGRKSTSLCMANEFLQDSYYMVKEVCRHQTPERIIYELDPGYWVTENNTGHADVFIYNNMPWSLTKLAYGLDKLSEKDFRASLFLWHYYRSNLSPSAVRANITEKRSRAYRNYEPDAPIENGEYYKGEGFLSHPRGAGENKSDTNIVLWSRESMRPEQEIYLKKLAALCKEKGIELEAVILPVPEETVAMYPDSYNAAYDYFEELLAAYDISCYNFNRIGDERIPKSLEDFYDYDGHMYADTAQIFSKVLGEYLKEE